MMHYMIYNLIKQGYRISFGPVNNLEDMVKDLESYMNEH